MIFKCTPQYLQQLGKFYDDTVKYLDEHINYPRWKYKYYPSLESSRQVIQSGTQYICVEEGQIVGAFVLNTDPQGAYHKAQWSKQIADGDYLVIHSFATRSDLYRRGIASKMLAYCIDLAKQQGKQAIRLDVVPTNYPAMAFYQKHGFTFVGELDLDREFEDIPTFCLYELNF